MLDSNLSKHGQHTVSLHNDNNIMMTDWIGLFQVVIYMGHTCNGNHGNGKH